MSQTTTSRPIHGPALDPQDREALNLLLFWRAAAERLKQALRL